MRLDGLTGEFQTDIILFQMIHQADYVVPVEIENQYHNVYVIKRPGVDGFLKAMGEIYEIVIFTASLSKYADPVLDQLDIHRVVGEGARLFRESCYNNKGNYVKVGCLLLLRARADPDLAADMCTHLHTGSVTTGSTHCRVHHHRQLASVLRVPPQQCCPHFVVVQ